MDRSEDLSPAELAEVMRFVRDHFEGYYHLDQPPGPVLLRLLRELYEQKNQHQGPPKS